MPTMDLRTTTLDYGTSKIVLSGPVRVNGVSASNNQVLIITTRQELVKSARALANLHHNALGWKPFETRYLDAYCFAREPHVRESRLLNQSCIQSLRDKYGHIQPCAAILAQPELCVVATKKYESVDHTTVIDILVSYVPHRLPCITSDMIRRSLGWTLLDTILGCYLLHQSGICHGDIKLNNLVYDRQRRRFKLNDFGLSSTYESIDFQKRFGKITYPWYHPFFQAIRTIDDANPVKRRLQRQHSDLIDRFAFVGVVYQLSIAFHASKLISEELRVQGKASLLILLSRLGEKTADRTPTNQQELRERRRQREFKEQSAKWLHKNRAHFLKKKEQVAVTFCDHVHRHNLYFVQEWSDLFRTVVDWAWPTKKPRVAESLDVFLESKKPAPRSSAFQTRSKRKSC